MSVDYAFKTEHLTRSFSGFKAVSDVSIEIPAGGVRTIIGPNGAGKTTLLKLLTGVDQPTTGEVKVGTNLHVETLDQQRASLDPLSTLQAALTGGEGDQVEVGGVKRHVIGYMKDFLFKPEQARTPVGVLSGGERGRLTLAIALARPSNLLVLDEPTNDLDLETLDLLQELLADYPGTVMLVSHDRDFLDRVVTSTLAAEGAGRWIEYAGGYSDMLIQRGTPAQQEARGRPGSKKAVAREGARPAKMSFKDKQALETLPADIARAQSDLARLQRVLTDANLYRKDPTKFRRTTESLAETQAKLAADEERWLALEVMREEMAS